MGFNACRRFPRSPRRRPSGRRLQSPGGLGLSGSGEVYFTGFLPHQLVLLPEGETKVMVWQGGS